MKNPPQKGKAACRFWLKRAIARGLVPEKVVSRIVMSQVCRTLEDMDTDLILACLAYLEPDIMRIDARLDPEARRMLETIRKEPAKKGCLDP